MFVFISLGHSVSSSFECPWGSLLKHFLVFLEQFSGMLTTVGLLFVCSYFQVPFIAFYRKEYVEPELNINDLWKVYQWDEKVHL